MGYSDAAKVQSRPAVVQQASSQEDDKALEMGPFELEEEKTVESTTARETGAAGIEAAQAVWGKRGRYLIIGGYEAPSEAETMKNGAQNIADTP